MKLKRLLEAASRSLDKFDENLKLLLAASAPIIKVASII